MSVPNQRKADQFGVLKMPKRCPVAGKSTDHQSKEQIQDRVLRLTPNLPQGRRIGDELEHVVPVAMARGYKHRTHLG